MAYKLKKIFSLYPQLQNSHVVFVTHNRNYKKVSSIVFFYLVNTGMRSKRDVKMDRLCTPGRGWEGSPRNCRWGCDVPFLKW